MTLPFAPDHLLKILISRDNDAIFINSPPQDLIVIHAGKGWFDPLGDGKGDVFRLVEHLDGVPFVDAMNDVAGLVGFVPSEPVWQRESREREPDLSIRERWQARFAARMSCMNSRATCSHATRPVAGRLSGAPRQSSRLGRDLLIPRGSQVTRSKRAFTGSGRSCHT